MQKLNLNKDADFLPVPEVCSTLNLGRNTVNKLAKDANAVLRIGRSVRINMPKLRAYIDNLCKS